MTQQVEETLFCCWSNLDYAWLERTEHTIEMFGCPMQAAWRNTTIGQQIELARWNTMLRFSKNVGVRFNGIHVDELVYRDTRMFDYVADGKCLEAQIIFWKDKIDRAAKATRFREQAVDCARMKYQGYKDEYEKSQTPLAPWLCWVRKVLNGGGK